MKKTWQETLHAIWMGMAVPGLILAILVMFWEKDKPVLNTEPETTADTVSLFVLARWHQFGSTWQAPFFYIVNNQHFTIS